MPKATLGAELPSEIAYLFVANVRDHRWLPVARPMAGSDSDQASGVTRVAIRWIALLAIALYCFVTKNLDIWPASRLIRESWIFFLSPPNRSNMGEWLVRDPTSAPNRWTHGARISLKSQRISLDLGAFDARSDCGCRVTIVNCISFCS